MFEHNRRKPSPEMLARLLLAFNVDSDDLGATKLQATDELIRLAYKLSDAQAIQRLVLISDKSIEPLGAGCLALLQGKYQRGLDYLEKVPGNKDFSKETWLFAALEVVHTRNTLGQQTLAIPFAGFWLNHLAEDPLSASPDYAELMGELSTAYLRSDSLDDAVRMATEITRRNTSQWDKAIAAWSLGQAELESGNFEAAAVNLNLARTLMAEQRRVENQHVLTQVSIAARLQTDMSITWLADAEHELLESLAYFEKREMYSNLASAQHTLAVVYLRKSELKASVRYLEQSLMNTIHCKPLARIRIVIQISKTYIELENRDRGVELLRSVTPLLADFSGTSLAASLWSNLASEYRNTGELDLELEALRNLAESQLKRVVVTQA